MGSLVSYDFHSGKDYFVANDLFFISIDGISDYIKNFFIKTSHLDKVEIDDVVRGFLDEIENSSVESRNTIFYTKCYNLTQFCNNFGFDIMDVIGRENLNLFFDEDSVEGFSE